LRIRAHTLVRRVLLSGRRVIGLEAETHGRVHVIASQRVVLCAGATSTPGILLRSGIGPRRAVERLGVDVAMDLPAVGARLLDHPGTAIFLRPRLRNLGRQAPLIQTVLRYRSKGGTQPNDVIVQPGSVVPLPYGALPLVSIMCSIGKPQGHGALSYDSPSPYARPRIDSRLFVAAADRARAADAMRLAVELAQSPPMRELATFFWPPRSALLRPGGIEAFISRMCDSSYHPCGTVPMGADGAGWADAATDDRGRVRGIHGLWIADASLMPTIPSAHTNLTVLMMGERFGEWFKNGMM
jgi:choline dehydrogenase